MRKVKRGIEGAAIVIGLFLLGCSCGDEEIKAVTNSGIEQGENTTISEYDEQEKIAEIVRQSLAEAKEEQEQEKEQPEEVTEEAPEVTEEEEYTEEEYYYEEEEYYYEEEPIYDDVIYTPPTGGCLTPEGGVYWFGEQRETWYNMDMSDIIYMAEYNGIEGYYWVRDDGCRMWGDYIIVAANRDVHPYGTLVETSLGTGISLDTGGFAEVWPYGVDIAVTW